MDYLGTFPDRFRIGMAVVRFWRRVATTGSENDCWNWTGTVNEDGYGLIRIEGKKLFAHRFAYQMASGIHLDDDLVVRHTCDNPLCCNPLHHVAGTHADNVADRVARHRSAVGTRNGRSKLSENQVRKILMDNRPDAEIAKEFSINRTTVVHIRARKIWRHVTP